MANDTLFTFHTWEDVILSTIGISRIFTDDNPIRTNPDINSGLVKYDCSEDDFKAVEFKTIEGDYWMKIEYSTTCESDCDKIYNEAYGWIKWRDRRSLLINLYFLC